MSERLTTRVAQMVDSWLFIYESNPHAPRIPLAEQVIASVRAEWEAERCAEDEATRRQIDGLASDYYEAIIRAERAEQGETEWEYKNHWCNAGCVDGCADNGRMYSRRVHPWLPVPGSTVRESDNGVRDSDSEESESEK